MEFDRIGKYQILCEIGAGTMGRVFKAWDPSLNRHVAIKTLSASLGAADESRRRFEREARAAAVLSHPNIITVHELGEERGLIFMAMELLEGMDLRTAITEGHLTDLTEKLRAMEQVAIGLAFAHGKGVIHRDLKPANIHIQPSGQVKIVDFGLARLQSSEITQTGIVMGTPHYMSPEQALGDRVDTRSDIFSAGTVFYELLSGKKPFDAETTPAVLFQVVHKEPTPLRDVAPDVPAVVADIVEKALTKSKKDRLQTARQLRAAISLALEAVENGCAPDTTLAGESRRAVTEAGTPATVRAGSGGTSVLAPALGTSPGLAPAPTTLPTRTPSAERRRRRPRPVPILVVSALVAFLLAVGSWLAYQYWPLGTKAQTAPVADTSAQIGALTRELRETRFALAERALADKDYPQAITHARSVLALDPRHADAQRIMEEAQARTNELGEAADEARQAFTKGDTERASQALGRVLELDPHHPVAELLTAQLNGVFRAQAEEARHAMVTSRNEAEAAGASHSQTFVAAAAAGGQAEALFSKDHFAEATRAFLEARDTFARSQRDARVDRPEVESASAPERAEAAPAAPPAAASTAPAGPAFGSVVGRETAGAAPAAPPHARFTTLPTRIATVPIGGSVQGFDGGSVRRAPDLAGRIDFVTPATLRSGEPFSVVVFFVNEGRKPARLRTVTMAVTLDGKKAAVPGVVLLNRQVQPHDRAALAEYRGLWPEAVGSWSLDVVVSANDNETGASRLVWE